MPTPLAPKRWCNECGKPAGRKWSNYNLCRDCTKKAFSNLKTAADGATKKGDDIPY